MSDFIETNTNDDGIDRRGFLKCMAWAGTGVIWSINGGLLTSTVLGQETKNLSAITTAELNFVQISDSHIGFNKPANTDVVGTFRETIAHINALPKVPEFLPLSMERGNLFVMDSIDLPEQAQAVGPVTELEQKVAANPLDHQARFDLATALNASGKRSEAIHQLLEIVKRDRKWNEDGARKQLVQFFEAWGPTDEATVDGRKRLSTILFS